METVVIVGGGPGGCAAALIAAKAGVKVVLMERMDSLSGDSPWCGQLMGWGPQHECRLMGGGDFYDVWRSLEMRRKSDYGVPDGNITWDVTKVEEATLAAMKAAGVEVMLRSRAVDVEMQGNRMTTVVLADGRRVKGDAFVDATGAGGSLEMCEQYGQGCAMCVLKCPIFGDRVTISDKAGVPDVVERPPSYYSMNFFALESFSPKLRRTVAENPEGYSYFPVPEEFYQTDFTSRWPRPQRPVKARWTLSTIEVVNVRFAKTHILLPMEYIRRIPGFENAWLAMPLVASAMAVKGASIPPHDKAMKVMGLDNVFVAGLRAGDYSSAVPAIFTGELAGHNAARRALGRDLLELPPSTIQGFFISKINRGRTPAEWGSENRPPDTRFPDAGFDIPRLVDYARIKASVMDAGLIDVYQRPLA
ncbi:MAG: FAD-dependent oxidoreductase [Chloroflexi bacterium]|nr:FAD-dependent oxidoreductase [Chloroflexota bacterium]